MPDHVLFVYKHVMFSYKWQLNKWYFLYSFVPESDHFISNVSCAEVLHYRDQELHLMRCSRDEVHNKSCGVARINCSKCHAEMIFHASRDNDYSLFMFMGRAGQYYYSFAIIA